MRTASRRVAVRWMVAVLAGLSSVVCGPWSVGHAQVPELINYQGRLLQGTNLVNATVSLMLRIYTNAVSGGYLYENSNTVTVVDGLYSTLIGTNTTYGTLTNALESGEAYLEVVVNGAVLAPRERLVSAPYALKAAGALKETITTVMLVDGAVTGDKIADNTIAPENLSTAVNDTFLNTAGDTMSGALNINAGGDLLIGGGSSGNIIIGDFTIDGEGARLGVSTLQDPLTTLLIGCGVIPGGISFATILGLFGIGGDDCVAVGYKANGGPAGTAVGYKSHANPNGVAVGYKAVGYNYGAALGLLAIGYNYGAALGPEANGAQMGSAVGWAANGYDYGAALGCGAWGVNQGVAIGFVANGVDNGVAIGRGAKGWEHGVAVGYMATGIVSGTALGCESSGTNYGAAVGKWASGDTYGAAVGFKANGFYHGVAVGDEANGSWSGAAVGRQANGYMHGAALGDGAKAWSNGVAVGYQGNGANNGIAVGFWANGYEYGAAVGHWAQCLLSWRGYGSSGKRQELRRGNRPARQRQRLWRGIGL